MLQQISTHIKQVLTNFTEDDSIIFNNTLYKLQKDNFSLIPPLSDSKRIAFIDGGQAEIITTGNFCLSFIRVASVIFENNIKKEHIKNEFFLFTKAVYQQNELFYESTIFPLQEKLIEEQDLIISSKDDSIKNGNERASITKVTNMARRFAELALAHKVDTDFILLDGTLEKTFPNEEKFLEKLQKVSSLAKSSTLFTTSGNSPVVLLNNIGPTQNWSYYLNHTTSFVKLHQNAKHVFRFEGNREILSYLTSNSTDALFLGYPYGLLLADTLARVSNQEKKSLMMQFLLKQENKEIAEYLHTSNAHSILDNLG